jgi:hypothetical protein
VQRGLGAWGKGISKKETCGWVAHNPGIASQSYTLLYPMWRYTVHGSMNLKSSFKKVNAVLANHLYLQGHNPAGSCSI